MLIERSGTVLMFEVPRRMHSPPLQLLEEVVVSQGRNTLVIALQAYVIYVEVMCICEQCCCCAAQAHCS